MSPPSAAAAMAFIVGAGTRVNIASRVFRIATVAAMAFDAGKRVGVLPGLSSLWPEKRMWCGITKSKRILYAEQFPVPFFLRIGPILIPPRLDMGACLRRLLQ